MARTVAVERDCLVAMSSTSVVDADRIERELRRLRLAGRPLEMHVSVRSFGGALRGGPTAIIDGSLAAGCTVLAATMAPDVYGIDPPADDRPARNGIEYSAVDPQTLRPVLYDASSTVVSPWLGAFSTHVAARADRVRCRYPSGEFAAVGPLAADLIGAETADDVFGPLRALVAAEGAVVLMGVGLTTMTLLHLAEVAAGRRPFIRWALGPDGRPTRVRAGECSKGFEAFAPALAAAERRTVVGASRWRIFDAAQVMQLATAAIRSDPTITHCPDSQCIECADAIAGGPLD